VAITRTKNILIIPENLVDEDLPESNQIIIIDDSKETDDNSKPEVANNKSLNIPPKEKTYSVTEVRKKFEGAYGTWTVALDDELTRQFCEGMNIKEIARHFGRTEGAIRSRIKKLELHELYG
jgi:F-box protein 18 (helicase)